MGCGLPTAVAQEQMFNFAYGRGRKAEIYLLVQGKANTRVTSAAVRVWWESASENVFYPSTIALVRLNRLGTSVLSLLP